MKKNGAGQSLFLALLISMGLFFFVQGKQLIESGASPVIFIAFRLLQELSELVSMVFKQ